MRWVAIVTLLLLMFPFGCKSKFPTQSLSGDKGEILRAQRGEVMGYIHVALIQPGDSMVIKAVKPPADTVVWKLFYPQRGFGRGGYIHHQETDNFYIPWDGSHTYYNYCGPLDETHVFYDPTQNFHPGGPWPYEHLQQHQRVWHYTYDFFNDTLIIMGLWDDFVTYSPLHKR